jgi:hypothetical protein
MQTDSRMLEDIYSQSDLFNIAILPAASQTSASCVEWQIAWVAFTPATTSYLQLVDDHS